MSLPLNIANPDRFSEIKRADSVLGMDFSPSDRVAELRERVRSFIDEHVLPVEAEGLAALDSEVRPGVAYPQILVELRERAKGEGLWNLFLPDEDHGPGLTNWEYGRLCED